MALIFSVPMQIDDDPFRNAPLNKGLNKKRLTSPKPVSTAHQNIQKPTVQKDPNAIHEDLLCLSMDMSPPSAAKTEVKEAASDIKPSTLHPEPSKGSPQLSTKSSKQKLTAAEMEALDNRPDIRATKKCC